MPALLTGDVLNMKVLNLCWIALAALALTAMPVAAADMPKAVGVGLGCGLVVLGLGIGLGRIGGSALESMARQPEVADKIQTAMIISAALIEGATFFGLIVCMLTIFM